MRGCREMGLAVLLNAFVMHAVAATIESYATGDVLRCIAFSAVPVCSYVPIGQDQRGSHG